MKRILVAGGAGFLGANLCRYLVQDKNNYVIAFDNLYTGKIENLEPIMCMDNFEFICGDVTNKLQIEADEVYNAACPASPVAYQKSPTTTTKTSVIGIINLGSTPELVET